MPIRQQFLWPELTKMEKETMDAVRLAGLQGIQGNVEREGDRVGGKSDSAETLGRGAVLRVHRADRLFCILGVRAVPCTAVLGGRVGGCFPSIE